MTTPTNLARYAQQGGWPRETGDFVMRVGQTRKRDFNEGAIVAALEAIGVTVYRVSGPGVPDLLTFSRGVWLPVEVKRPRGKLTAAQIEARQRTPYPVVETVDQALALFGVRA